MLTAGLLWQSCPHLHACLQDLNDKLSGSKTGSNAGSASNVELQALRAILRCKVCTALHAFVTCLLLRTCNHHPQSDSLTFSALQQLSMVFAAVSLQDRGLAGVWRAAEGHRHHQMLPSFLP